MNAFPPIIGITGKAGAGKDTLAGMLCEYLDYRRYSLADPMKQELNEQFGWDWRQWDDRTWKETPCVGGRSPRQLAQWFGTYCRGIKEDYWILKLIETAQDEGNVFRMIVPDVRFDNEARILSNMGGVILGVERRGVAPVNAHVSEQGLNPALVHSWIPNNSTPEDMFLMACGELRAWHGALCTS